MKRIGEKYRNVLENIRRFESENWKRKRTQQREKNLGEGRREKNAEGYKGNLRGLSGEMVLKNKERRVQHNEENELSRNFVLVINLRGGRV